MQKEGLDVLYHELDVTDKESVNAIAKYLEGEHDRVDVLVNNAGILLGKYDTSVLDEKETCSATTLETNFYGALRMSQALVPLMQKHRYGRVVNLSSGLGQLDEMGDGASAYRVSKTALNALTRMLATAVAPTTTSWSIPCARGGSGPTWAARPPSAASRRAPKPRSGWPCCPTMVPRAVSSATRSQFPGKSQHPTQRRRGRKGRRERKRGTI